MSSFSASASDAGATLNFVSDLKRNDDDVAFDATVILGRRSSVSRLLRGGTSLSSDDAASSSSSSFLADVLGIDVPDVVLNAMVDGIDEKKGGSAAGYAVVGSDAHRLALCCPPTYEGTRRSSSRGRNFHPLATHAVPALLRKSCARKGATRVVVVLPDDDENEDRALFVAPVASAVAKAFPLYDRRTASASSDGDGDVKRRPRTNKQRVDVVFCNSRGRDGVVDDPVRLRAARAVARGVRLAGRLVDAPPDTLDTNTFVEECRALANEFPNRLSMTELVGDDLLAHGGLHNVGKAAVSPPRLVVMSYEPKENVSKKTVALVGKGIVYDTGGLSLKPKTGMCGMKRDMGGAAGLLGGLLALTETETPVKVHLLLCLAENAIGPDAVRNDDIITLYSGKTVEINNCDAEGRLVLGDGVAHATRHLAPDLVLDMATLTGAQLVATGKRHAGILANTRELEDDIVRAGLRSGDLVYPLLYAPETLMDEFASKVADMKNSVKDRSNAQTSCAGHFIEAHLDEDYEGGWIHVDMAGPSEDDGRGTGYGVALVAALLDAPGF